MPRQGGVGRQRQKFLAGAQPRLPLVSTPQISMEQTRVHRTGHALARAKDLLAMSIPSRMAGHLKSQVLPIWKPRLRPILVE